MNLKLIRNSFEEDGIFGMLIDDNGNQIAVTLEHAFQQTDGSYAPKIPVGTYTCQRGQHQLAHMTSPFTTFVIANVPGHTNILIHFGNYNSDSNGCILVGETEATTKGGRMITDSRVTFDKFMALQNGLDTFTLVVT